MRSFLPIIGLVVFARVASAQQPIQDPMPPDMKPASTVMPVEAPDKTEVLGAENTGATSSAAAVALEEPINPSLYRCGPGDVFELNFWGKQNFRLRIAADLEGRVFISKVGYVSVSGKTLATVRTDVKKKVRDDYPGLQFELSLMSPRSFLVHVVNYVRTPGAYVASPLERVSALLAKAGGTTGSRRAITIRHKSGDPTKADLQLYELTGDTQYNPYVLDGDVIEVPAADVMVAIGGAVRRPGSYELVKSRDLTELLSLAGGFSTAVSHDLPIRITRRNEHQQEIVEEVPFAGGAPNVALHDLDQVFVQGAAEVQRTILIIGAVANSDQIDAAATSKRLPYVEGDTVRSLIERAGGIRATGDLRRAYIARDKSAGGSTMVPVDLDALLVRRDFHADKPVHLGDTIVIPPLTYSILVEGAVARSGLQIYNPEFGIAEYIAHAGGRTRTARDLDEVKLIDINGKTHNFDTSLKPNPGDAILVPERNFSRAEIAQLVLAGAGLLVSSAALVYAVTR